METGDKSSQNSVLFSIAKVNGPDGIEAWCVAFAACVINFIMAGLARMSGILYVAFIDIFQVDRRDASLPFSVRSSIRNLLGPAVGILGQKYGPQPVILTGAVIGSMSAAACFYAQDMLWITILWGGVSGFAAALTTTLNQAVIGQHFKKYRTTAAGMAFSGGCVGSFLFPALLEYLIDDYGLGGTFLIISGILMHVIPAALILKKPSWVDRSHDVHVSTISGKVTEVLEDYAIGPPYAFPDKTCSIKRFEPSIMTRPSEFEKKINKHLLWENRSLVINLLTNGFTQNCPNAVLFHNKLFRNVEQVREIEDLFNKITADVYNYETVPRRSANAPNAEQRTEDLKSEILSNESLKSHTVRSPNLISSSSLNCLTFSLNTLFEIDRKNILSKFSESDHETLLKILDELWYINITLDTNQKNYWLRSFSSKDITDTSNTADVKNNSKPSNSFYSHIKTAFRLFKKPIFVLVCLCRTMHTMTFMPVVTTVVDFAMDKGLSIDDGKYVIAALSLGDLMGRLCFGWITDRGYVSLPRYMMFVMVIQGAATSSLSFMDSRVTVMIGVAVFGLLQGSVFVRHPVLVSGYMESHEQSIGMGCLNLFSGLLSFVLPSYIGYFRDIIGSYNGMFYINGAVGAFVGLLWIFEPYFVKLSNSEEKGNILTHL